MGKYLAIIWLCAESNSIEVLCLDPLSKHTLISEALNKAGNNNIHITLGNK